MLMMPTLSFQGLGDAAPPAPPSPSLAQKWRARFPSGSADPNQVGLTELEFRATVGGANLCAAGGGSASTANAGDPASEAFDGTTTGVNGWFTTSGNSVNSWLANDFGSASDVEEAVIYGYGTAGYGPTEIVFEYEVGGVWYDDSARWPTINGLVWDINETKYFRRTGLGANRIVNVAALNALAADGDGWSNFTLRQVFAATVVPGGGTRVRIALRAGSTQALAINKCYVGIKGAGSYDFTTTPTQVTFDGGSASTTITANTAKWSDEITLTIGASDALVVSMYIPTGTTTDMFRRSTGSQTGVTGGFKAGDDAVTQTAVSYSSVSQLFLDELEVSTP